MSKLKEVRGMKRCKYLENESSKKSEDESCMEVDEEVDEEYEEEQWFMCKYGDSEDPAKKLRGTYLDVISLLSNNGNTDCLVKSDGSFVGLQFVKGKHLVICCVSLPLTDDHDESEPCLRAIVDTYSSHKNDFEMVVAVTINNNQESVYDAFLSTLPCLAIPFPDLDTRNSICSFIGFPVEGYFHSEVSAIFVNPTGIILHGYHTPTLFLNYGFEWFTTNVREIALQDDILRFRLDPFHKKLRGNSLPKAVERDAILRKPLSLYKDILLCDPSLVLSTISGRSLTVSQLSKKYVGLYLCINLHFLDTLKYIHDECIENKHELEIVLVCLPIYDKPKAYYEQLFGFDTIKSWFIFPYDNKVCRRLWRVFCFEEIVDRFIILPPKGKPGELEGRTVVRRFCRLGIDAYPFTRSAILKQRLATLKSVTPASLFKGTCETHTCLVVQNNVVPQSAIKGKNLLLYVDRIQLSDKHTKLCRLLMKHYPKIQAMGCEVVYIPFNTSEVPDVQLAKMPWPMMPVKAVAEAWETIKLFRKYDETLDCFVNQVIALGKDGGILSTRLKKQLKTSGVNNYLFIDSLREEIIEDLDLMEDQGDEAY